MWNQCIGLAYIEYEIQHYNGPTDPMNSYSHILRKVLRFQDVVFLRPLLKHCKYIQHEGR